MVAMTKQVFRMWLMAAPAVDTHIRVAKCELPDDSIVVYNTTFEGFMADRHTSHPTLQFLLKMASDAKITERWRPCYISTTILVDRPDIPNFVRDGWKSWAAAQTPS